jgi:hypothetical protein
VEPADRGLKLRAVAPSVFDLARQRRFRSARLEARSCRSLAEVRHAGLTFSRSREKRRLARASRSRSISPARQTEAESEMRRPRGGRLPIRP